MILKDQAEFFTGTRDADIKQTAGLAKSCCTLLVVCTGKIARIHAIHHDGVKLSSLRAVQRAQARATCPLDRAGQMGKRNIEVCGWVGIGNHLCADMPLLL